MGKRREQAVTRILEYHTSVSGDGLHQDGIGACKHGWHVLRVLLPESGAAFDIREEECDRAARER